MTGVSPSKKNKKMTRVSNIETKDQKFVSIK